MGILSPQAQLDEGENQAIKTRNPLHSLVIACGALATEVIALRQKLNLQDCLSLTCLPAIYHNYPEKIVPALQEKIDQYQANFDRIFIGYGDCGTGGGLDRFIHLIQTKYPHCEFMRIQGAHCYEFYAGSDRFATLQETEIGSFYLTDYLVRFFDPLIIKGLGLDRFPQLKSQYFGHYKKLIYLSQQKNLDLQQQAETAAQYLGLEYQLIATEFGELQNFIAASSFPHSPLSPTS